MKRAAMVFPDMRRLICRTRCRITAALLLTGLGLLAAAHGRDLHVASEAEAKQALAKAEPGDHVIVRNGRYTGWHLTLDRNGTREAPIVLRAETPGQVVFTGNTHIVIAADHVAVRGFTFSDVPGRRDGKQVVLFTRAHHSELANNLFIRSGAHRWRRIVQIEDGSHDNTVSHNKFIASKGQGVGILGRGEPSLRNTISHNHFDGTLDDGEDNGQEPIQLGQAKYTDSSYAALVEYNLIENMKGDADPEMISVKLRGAHIRRNVLIHDGKGGTREIVLRHAADAVIEQNLLIGVGIRVFGPNHVVRGNQIVGRAGYPRHGIRVPSWGGQQPYPDTDGVEIFANTLVGTVRSCIRVGQRNGHSEKDSNRIRGVTVTRNVCRSDQGSLYVLDRPMSEVHYETNIAEGRAQPVAGPIPAGVERRDAEPEGSGTGHSLLPMPSGEPWDAVLAAEVGPYWQRTNLGERVRR